MAERKMSQKELEADKHRRIMEGVAVWASFYRCNPHRFVKDYLNVELKLFQKILLYGMMINNYFMYIAARGQLAVLIRNNRVIKVGEIGEG